MSLLTALTLALLSAAADQRLSSEVISANGHNLLTTLVLIDAGHGGFDGGAVAEDGTLEKDLNLLTAEVLADICRAQGLSVHMLREEDASLDTVPQGTVRERKNSDLNNRLRTVNSYDGCIFVSIHMNKFSDPRVCGAQVFYGRLAAGSKSLAEAVRSSLVELSDKNNRAIKCGDDSIYLLKNAKCPSIIVECGFLSNPEELHELKDEKHRRQLAFSIYLGITEYLNGE